MKYKELAKNYSSNKFIPYDELLLTDEWLNKRKTILERDNYYCTKCNTTSSVWNLGENVSFIKNKIIEPKNIITCNWSVQKVKDIFEIDNIYLFRHPIHESYHYGLSNNKILFVANYQDVDYSETPYFDFSVLENGTIIPIIKSQNVDHKTSNILIPKISRDEIFLHVHHKYYLKDKLPWEYEDETLITLCNWCHWELHNDTTIPIYRKNSNDELIELHYKPCSRCNGAGIFPQYKHVQNGICFRCGGSKYEELIEVVQ